MNAKLAAGLLSVSLFGISSLLAAAPVRSDTDPQCLRTPEMVGPVTLVQLAYQGALEKQGIPSAEGLVAGFYEGNITPSQIVDAAVKACILKEKYKFSTNEGYLEDMKIELQGLNR